MERARRAFWEEKEGSNGPRERETKKIQDNIINTLRRDVHKMLLCAFWLPFVCTKEVNCMEEGSEDIIHNKLRNLFLLNFVKRKNRSFHYPPRRYCDNILLHPHTSISPAYTIHIHVHAQVIFIVSLRLCATLIQALEPKAR